MSRALSATRRLMQLSASNKLRLIEALMALAVASAAIRLVPFSRLVETMDLGNGGSSPARADQWPLVASCRWAINALADRVPWKAVCFQRGLALHWMLRRRGIESTLHYGVSPRSESGLTAHVWLSLHGKIILGGDVAQDYACLATFPASPPEAGPLQPLRASGPVQEP